MPVCICRVYLVFTLLKSESAVIFLNDKTPSFFYPLFLSKFHLSLARLSHLPLGLEQVTPTQLIRRRTAPFPAQPPLLQVGMRTLA